MTSMMMPCPCPSHTAGSETIFIQIYMDAPPRVPGGVKKSESFFYKKTVEFLPPKGTNFEKSSKLKKKVKKPCFPRVFQIFFYLGAILVHQTSNRVFSGPWRIF